MQTEILLPQLTPAQILEELEKTDLRPSARVNTLFNSLVAYSLQYVADIPTEQTARLRELCAVGEYNMEQHWATQIIDRPETLQDFPYLDNYLDLTSAEYDAIQAACDHQPQRVAFVGSGPLPLSGLFLARLNRQMAVDCIDKDWNALVKGQAVVSLLDGADTNCRLVWADAYHVDYSQYDVIILAALVGSDNDEKSALLRHISRYMKSDGLLAARSVPDDGRQLLYPRLESIPEGLEYLVETIPPPGVINNLIFMQPKQ